MSVDFSEKIKKLRINNVTDEFIQPVTSLANRVALSHLSEKERKWGFLVPYTESQYKSFTRDAEHFYVLCLENRPIGFVLAHSNDKIGLFGGEVYLHLKNLQRLPFLVVRQICIDPEFSHKGYGRKLYEFLINRAAEDPANYRTMVCFIWKSPYHNQSSEKFHRTIGWKELKTYILKNRSGAVGIWGLAIDRPNSG